MFRWLGQWFDPIREPVPPPTRGGVLRFPRGRRPPLPGPLSRPGAVPPCFMHPLNTLLDVQIHRCRTLCRIKRNIVSKKIKINFAPIHYPYFNTLFCVKDLGSVIYVLLQRCFLVFGCCKLIQKLYSTWNFIGIIFPYYFIR